jgi:hypothetical protein
LAEGIDWETVLDEFEAALCAIVPRPAAYA